MRGVLKNMICIPFLSNQISMGIANGAAFLEDHNLQPKEQCKYNKIGSPALYCRTAQHNYLGPALYGCLIYER